MKRYLNSQEKKDFLQIVMYGEAMRVTHDKWIELGRKGLAKKYFAMACSLLRKVADIMIDGLDPVETEKLLTYSKKLVAVVGYSDQAKREYNAMLAMDDVLPVKTDDFYQLCEQGCEICKTCKLTGDKEVKCNLRRILISYDVCVADFHATGCPYRLNLEEAV